MSEPSTAEGCTAMQVGEAADWGWWHSAQVHCEVWHSLFILWISQLLFPTVTHERSNGWNSANWADFILKSQWSFRSQATSSKDNEAVEVISLWWPFCEPHQPSHDALFHPQNFPQVTQCGNLLLWCIHQLYQLPPKQVQAWMILSPGPPMPGWSLFCPTFHPQEPLLTEPPAHRYSH